VKGQEKDPNVLVTESGIRVSTQEVAKARDYIVTDIRLERGDQEHYVKHVQLQQWPDYGGGTQAGAGIGRLGVCPRL
jgi:hypothetical protein